MTIQRLEKAIRKILKEPDLEEDEDVDHEPRRERDWIRDWEQHPRATGFQTLLRNTTKGVVIAGVIAVPSWYMLHGSSVAIQWEAGSTAVCRDGWFSHSHHRSGTCSGHEGVFVWRYPATDPIWR